MSPWRSVRCEPSCAVTWTSPSRIITVSSQSKNQRNSPAVQSQIAVEAASSPLRECRPTRATGFPEMIQDGSIGAGSIGMSSKARDTSGGCSAGAATEICRNIIAAVPASIIFQAINSSLKSQGS